MKNTVQKTIKELKLYWNEDDEDIELTDVDEEKGAVIVKLKGAGVHYPKSLMGIQLAVEEFLKSSGLKHCPSCGH